MQYVARAKPDGYTVLLALSSISIIPAADRILGRDPMFQLGQLVPIARFTADPTVLAVRADSPWKSAKDMLEAAKKAPGAIPYGSSGNYGTMHVPMEMLAAAAGAKMLHVPFTGAGPAVVALLGGSVDALSTGPSTVMGHVQGGKVRVLASWGEARHPALPDVPTLKELGYDATFSQWTGLFVPAGRRSPSSPGCARPRRPRRTTRPSSRRSRGCRRRCSTSTSRSSAPSGTPTRRSSRASSSASERSSSAYSARPSATRASCTFGRAATRVTYSRSLGQGAMSSFTHGAQLATVKR